ncbi:cellulose-binding domain-containing protein [Mycobacterium sp. SMC-18]|uniref:cellulose-binding domain-containing protein n=1 Tax=Mycobacterium sp. SMC-18 TaxID=3381629 RepID=UPI0038774992
MSAGLSLGCDDWTGLSCEALRAALHVVVSALTVAFIGLVGTPVAHAAAAGARLVVQHTWQDGFIARFVVTNYSTVPMADWKIEFDMPVGQSISHAWSSTFAQYGTHYVITPASWNRVIPPGGTANGGIRGILSGTYTPPSNCVLNGQVYCS